MIRELRYRGPNGANDEYVEIYNHSNQDHVVKATAGSGYGIAASDGVTRFIIPNGYDIPARGHFLGVNSVGYGLASYPAGSGTTATGDATFTTNIPDNAGVAIFDNSVGGASYNMQSRLDAVGSTAEPNALYKEGNGLPTLVGFSIDYAWTRRIPGTGSPTPNGCLPSLRGADPQDTGDNAKDFLFVDTNGTSAGGGQLLGAPSPKNLSSPLVLGGSSAIALSTFPPSAGVADLRPRTSTAVVTTRAKVGGGTENVTVQGTKLEQPPSQPNGGGFNSTLSVPTVSLANPLPAGGSVDVRLLFGVQQKGSFQFFVEAEGSPGATRAVWGLVGDTENGAMNVDCAVKDSTTSIASSSPTTTEGENVTLTATSAAGNAAATGDVTFVEGAKEIATVKLVAGKAQLVTNVLGVGAHEIRARYHGDGSTNPSESAPIHLDVQSAPNAPPQPAASSASSTSTPASSEPADPSQSADPNDGVGPSAAAADDGADAGGCNAGRRADASSISMLALLLAAALVAARRRA